MRYKILGCLLLFAVALCAPPPSAEAGTRTGIRAADASEPRKLWAAVMEHFYGDYDKALKCWIGMVDGERQCMYPHRLDTVTEGGIVRHYIVTGGFPAPAGGSHDTCHVCTGSLGLIVLEEAGQWLELAARNSLAEKAGSWGVIPPEESFRLREIGDGHHG